MTFLVHHLKKGDYFHWDGTHIGSEHIEVYSGRGNKAVSKAVIDLNGNKIPNKTARGRTINL